MAEQMVLVPRYPSGEILVEITAMLSDLYAAPSTNGMDIRFLAGKVYRHIVSRAPELTAPTPPSDESPVGERKPYPDGFIISESEAAARCPGLHASCWRAYDKLAKENDELRAAPQPERVTEARVEAAAKAVYELEPFYMPTGEMREGIQIARKFDYADAPATSQIRCQQIARAALEASLSISSEGEGGLHKLSQDEDQ